MTITKALAMTSLSAALLPAAAEAQSWRWQPSLAFGERSDDNLFARPAAPEHDWITGLEAGLLLTRDAAGRSFHVAYRQSAERYALHPTLDALDARQEGSLRWESRVSRSLAAGLTATYLRTASAGELYRSSGIDLGRIPARRLQLSPSLVRRLSERTTMGADATLTRDSVAGSAPLDGAVTGLRLEHRASPLARVTLRVQGRWYDAGPGRTVASQLVAAGYHRRLGRALELDLDAGPRLSRGVASAEWLAALGSRGRRGAWAAEWSQGEAAVVGAASTVVTRRLGAFVSRTMGPVEARLGLDSLQNHGGLETRAWQAAADARVRLGDSLALAAAAAWSRQRDDTPARAAGEVRHLVTELRLVLRPGSRREIVDAR